LARNLYAVTSDLYAGRFANRTPTEELLCDFHRALFFEVRDHCGKIRSPEFGSESLTFGPNRSVQRSAVPAELDKVMKTTRHSLRSFDENPEAEEYEIGAIRLGAWLHAEIVRIHPFEDGNGRSSRLMLNWVLLRLGMQPVVFEAVKEEYRDCLNHYYRSGDLEPLVDICIRLATDPA